MRQVLHNLGTVVDHGRDERRDGAWLADAAARRAGALARAGVRPGDVVAIAHGNSPAFFADLFAVWRSGAAAAVLNPALTPPELENVLRFLGPQAVLGAAGNRDLLCLAETEADPAPFAEMPAEAPALILFTSGTTGTPKGVVLSAGAVAARVAQNAKRIGGETLARSLCLLPTHFGHGLLGNCLTPLLNGAELHLAPDAGLQAAQRLGRTLDERRITFMSSVPAFWRLALRFPPPAAGTLRQVSVGSAPLAADLWRRIVEWSGTDNVVNMYGLTETANWFAGASACDRAPADGLVGRPWGGEAAVRGEDGAIRPSGEGELLLRSPSLMSGYYRRPDLSAEALAGGWYRSGDWGRIEPDGTIHLVGRRRDEINRAGVKVHPEEIDALLERHPEVIEACAFGLDDAASGEIVAVAVRLAPGAAVDAAALRAWCGERIKRECVPERWFVIDAIPLNERGKVSRAAVRRLCAGDA